FFCWYGDSRDLHSFPTRRSSDLGGIGRRGIGGSPATLAVPSAAGEVVLPERMVLWPHMVPVAPMHQVRGSRTGGQPFDVGVDIRSEEHTSELQSRENLVCRLLLE